MRQRERVSGLAVDVVVRVGRLKLQVPEQGFLWYERVLRL